MGKSYKILTINPGSTSTKVAYFEGLSCISSQSLSHVADHLDGFRSVIEQHPLRKKAVTDYLDRMGIGLQGMDAVVGRGGLLKPVKGGTYRVNSQMLEDLESLRYGEHASNLGAVIAYELAEPLGIPAFIVNPVVVDEMWPPARISGLSGISRKSVFHALNQKAVGIRAAKEIGRQYDQLNLVIAHLGGGITVAAHQKGQVVDVNNGLEEGPFSPERTGSLPVQQLVDLCFSGRYTREEVHKLLVGKGGLVSYFGTSDCAAVEAKAAGGSQQAKEILHALAYQVAKEIGAYSAVLSGRVDAIVLTGGLAHSTLLTGWIEDMVRFIAPVKVYPGEDEMLAMAEGAHRVLAGQEEVRVYK